MTNMVSLNLIFKCACTVCIVVKVITTLMGMFPEIQHELGHSELPAAILRFQPLGLITTRQQTSSKPVREFLSAGDLQELRSVSLISTKIQILPTNSGLRRRLQASEKTAAPKDPRFQPMSPEQRRQLSDAQANNLQGNEGYCKPLGLWWFVTQQQETNTGFGTQK